VRTVWLADFQALLTVIITGFTVAAHFRGYTYIVPLLGDVAGVASVSVLVVGLQGWVLELAPEQSDTASALYVAIFNLGIGTGAMAGGAVLQMAGERPVPWTGITVGAGTCVGLTIQISRAVTAKVPGSW
jgi:MFS transporter, DHA1 family, L-arabinose/isopropyl-beta-D-thiogalactopyranoside export protein